MIRCTQIGLIPSAYLINQFMSIVEVRINMIDLIPGISAIRTDLISPILSLLDSGIESIGLPNRSSVGVWTSSI